ncbi:hypothetical protein [Larkinella humicola]|uniref:Lipocalin-like protein n=1 Tax=Larkinella humicola TaxID=2607654 RepID=A0A5N1J8J1_9BACT|nr:hypothetical protein [Larkinella humicola]KAA9347782.1 hypothetical protein F0P93_24440 [Larkinella humicola]
MKRNIFIFLTLLFCLGVQACDKPGCGCAPPLSSELMGKWEWIKTVTPTQVITPQTMGNRRILQHENDGNVDYVAFYQNDSLYLKLVRSRNFNQEDKDQRTILENYGTHQMKYFLIGRDYRVTREMQTSDLMKAYTEQADTVRHFYKYAGR